MPTYRSCVPSVVARRQRTGITERDRYRTLLLSGYLTSRVYWRLAPNKDILLRLVSFYYAKLITTGHSAYPCTTMLSSVHF